MIVASMPGFLLARKKSSPPGERPEAPYEPGTFEWGNTAETDAFFARHPAERWESSGWAWR
jgi:hypothetical protein